VRFGTPLNFWLLLVLPLLAAFLAWALIARRRLLALFARQGLIERLTVDVSSARPYWKAWLLLSGSLFLLLSLTGPQFGAKLSMAQRRGVDVVVVLDVSRSMLAEDVKPNRLERARHQIRSLLDRLGGDRVGLVLFAGKAFVQCPLTLDYGAVEMLLDGVAAGAIPVQGTAVADAVRVAARCFDQDDRHHKVIVLFTDGEDHEGDPVKAARAAAEEGVRLFAIGLGTQTGELIPEQSGEGRGGFHKDREGKPVVTRLNESVLKQMALVTEGDYYRSSLGEGELDAIGEQVAQMDQKEFGSTRFTQYEERFQVPLLLALICFFAEALLGDGRTRQKEWKGRFA
jgi:Ca-activated chloride channel family protein